MMASASDDGTVRIWGPAPFIDHQNIEGNYHTVSLCFLQMKRCPAYHKVVAFLSGTLLKV